MEQRIGQNMPPVNVAANDPARIPGLVPTESTTLAGSEESEAEAVRATDAAEAKTDVATDVDAATDADTDADKGADAEERADTKAVGGTGEADESAEEAEEADEAEEAEEVRNPAAEAEADDVTLVATDRRGGVEAGPKGVHFTLDDQETSFTWQEIGAVEHKISLTGRWFHLIVSTVGQGRYQVDVSTNRKRAKEWQGELEAVLDAYFDA